MTHTIRDDTKAFLAYLEQLGGTPIERQTPAQARESLRAAAPADAPPRDTGVLRDIAIPDGPPVRLIDARSHRSRAALVVWFHGGGFVTGDVETHTSLATQVAEELDLPVLLVDYRLAPEAPFPAAHDDALTAARWAASGPDDLGFRVEGLVLCGDSAGGNLAIATALALRDAPAAVPVLAHLAIYPSTDETRNYPSEELFGEGYLLTRAGKDWYREHLRSDPDDVRASPLRADLAGMPPGVVVTAGLDPNRDEGRAYAQALIGAGVATTFLEAAGNIHAFVLLRRAIPSSEADVRDALRALDAHLHPDRAQHR